jgi:hypothetical protein
VVLGGDAQGRRRCRCRTQEKAHECHERTHDGGCLLSFQYHEPNPFFSIDQQQMMISTLMRLLSLINARYVVNKKQNEGVG